MTSPAWFVHGTCTDVLGEEASRAPSPTGTQRSSRKQTGESRPSRQVGLKVVAKE